MFAITPTPCEISIAIANKSPSSWIASQDGHRLASGSAVSPHTAEIDARAAIADMIGRELSVAV